MTSVKGYILSVTTAAMVCAIVSRLAGKSTTGTIIKVLSGLFLTLTVLSPFVKLEIDQLSYVTESFRQQAEEAAALGELASKNMLNSIIKEELQAYVLDKAREYGVEPEVEIELNEGIPSGIRLFGQVSPYVKAQLAHWLKDELGIPLEAQFWTG